ncbi:hypothetical protein JCM10213_007611 [Rhodosporidiobolus nylandii]
MPLRLPGPSGLEGGDPWNHYDPDHRRQATFRDLFAREFPQAPIAFPRNDAEQLEKLGFRKLVQLFVRHVTEQMYSHAPGWHELFARLSGMYVDPWQRYRVDKRFVVLLSSTSMTASTPDTPIEVAVPAFAVSITQSRPGVVSFPLPGEEPQANFPLPFPLRVDGSADAIYAFATGEWAQTHLPYQIDSVKSYFGRRLLEGPNGRMNIAEPPSYVR